MAAPNSAEPISTPWGPAGAVIMCLLPIVFLILVTMVRRIMLPSRISLPLAAALMAAVRLAYLSAPPLEVIPAMVAGCLEAFIPLSVVFGAILLFQSMQHTKRIGFLLLPSAHGVCVVAFHCMPWMMMHVKSLSAGNPVAEIFLIGWAFAYTIEGIGGFGAPVALGAPMLVSLGHDPLLSVVVLVILNSIASHIGSVGMVVWFGFKALNLGDANILLIGTKAAVLVGVATFVCAPYAAAFLAPWREIRRSWLFVLLSLLSAVAPTFLVAKFSQDFPVVVGGVVSTAVTGFLVYHGIGLKQPLCDTTGSLARAATLKAAAEAAFAELEATAAAAGVGFPAGKMDLKTCSQEAETAINLAECGRVHDTGTDSLRSGSLTRRVSALRTKSGKFLQSAASALPGSTYCTAGEGSTTDVAAAAAAPPAEAQGGSPFQDCRPMGESATHMEDVAWRRGDIESCSMTRISAVPVLQGLPCTAGSTTLPGSKGTSKSFCTATRTSPVVPVVLACTAPTLKDSQHVTSKSNSRSKSMTAGMAASFSDGLEARSQPVAVTACAKAGISLGPFVEVPGLTLKDAVLRTMPIWLTVLILLITRVPQMRVKELVTRYRSISPAFYIHFGTLGNFSMSASLVMQLTDILTNPTANFKYEWLYAPCILPFVAASVITLIVHRRDIDAQHSWRTPFREAWARMVGTIAAMMGALALAETIRAGGTSSPAYIIGFYLSDWMGQGYVAIAGLLGALSSFVGGSVMAGNITFGGIQMVAAERIGVPVTSMLALQDAGCCAGKMICIANILACKAVMNLHHVGEGVIIKRTAPPALLLILLSTALSTMFLFAAPGNPYIWPDHPIPDATV